MLKVVINQCYGGFGLSNEAVERCIELGMKLTKYSKKNLKEAYEDPAADFVESGRDHGGEKYYRVTDYDDLDKDKLFRCNPILIKVVEELGEKANGFCAELGIIEIPFDSVQGWRVSEYDGNEEIVEEHRSWR